jgi:mono/diheme cytochrome c family protein
MKTWKWGAAGLGAALGLAAIAAGYQIVETRSQVLLEAKHVRPPVSLRAATAADDVVAGRHLVVVTGCTFCHGDSLTGPSPGPASSLLSPNLTLVVGQRSDAELDRAIRWGLHADGSSELAMPSYAYRWFNDQETSQIIGYLRSLPPRGAASSPPRPGFLTRLSLVLGRFKTEAEQRAEARPPLDVGPQFESGRRLTALACGQCHGADLAGGPGLPGPDLTVRDYFNRAQFHQLMRTGEMPQNVHSELMQEVARKSLSQFTTDQVDEIYDYLKARDARLAASALHDKSGSGG